MPQRRNFAYFYEFSSLVHQRPGASSTETPFEGSGDDSVRSVDEGVIGVTSEAPRQGCRADDVVTCPEDNSVRICEVQLCDGHKDCPWGYDELNCSSSGIDLLKKKKHSNRKWGVWLLIRHLAAVQYWIFIFGSLVLLISELANTLFNGLMFRNKETYE